jgi:hypothetical protein
MKISEAYLYMAFFDFKLVYKNHFGIGKIFFVITIKNILWIARCFSMFVIISILLKKRTRFCSYPY